MTEGKDMDEGATVELVGVLDTGELQALALIVRFYSRKVFTCKVASERERQTGRELEALASKVEGLELNASMLLSVEEMTRIQAAMAFFLSEVRRRLEPSPKREKVLESGRQLQAYLHATFPVP